MALDLTRNAGQEILRRLIPTCDMLVANVPESRLAALGLGYERLRAVNPKLIYGVLTPFGEEGPWKDLPDYDLIVMAAPGCLRRPACRTSPPASALRSLIITGPGTSPPG